MLETIYMDDMQEMWESLTSCTPAAGQDDKDGPREPPPLATPLDFPRCEPSKLSVSELGMSNDLVKLFSSTLRTGPTAKNLQALNVSVANELSLEQVVPTDLIPDLSWLEDPATSKCSKSSQAALSKSNSLSNGAPAPGREDFFVRVKELLYDNEDAFRAIQRKPPLPNRQPARIGHFRKFWEGLLLVAEHWDTSLDKYSTRKDTENKSAMGIDELHSEATETELKMETDKGEDLKKTYTGRRTGTGRDMPGKYREDTVFVFIETLTWAFRCRLEQPNSQQILELQGTMIPILHAASVHRVPKDVREARRGVAEGPMLGVFCREQTSFRSLDEAEGEGKQEILDLLRETGVMLMLAQKRAREGKEEEVPGRGKWWANAPRWGSGAGGELGVANEETTEHPTSSESSRKRVKKASRMDAWKSLQPPSRIWERGVTYQQIGKDKNSEHDDVSEPNGRAQTHPSTRIYLASSINHHISILHLRIHQKYIDYLQKAPAQSKISNAPQQSWYALEMKRSKWFDLLVANDRVEAMRGIWAILGWQMRDMTDAED
ncbi:MAG: hypothetical protein Q9175_002697 [Cornicularia normoerica]